MKILAITPYAKIVGGANRSLLMVLENLKNKYNHDIVVALPYKSDLSDALDEIGIPWKTIKVHEIIGVKSYSPKDILRLVKANVLALIDKNNAKSFADGISDDYDLVYINDNACYIGAYVAMCMNLPYIWHFRTLLKPDVKFIFGAKKLFDNCNRIIAISNGMLELLKSNPSIPNEKLECIHNGVPVEDAKKSIQVRDDGMHFVQCGRLTPDKGHTDAIKALGLLKREGISDIFLHIVGPVFSGHESYMESLKALSKELDVEHQVIFEGSRDDMPRFRENMNGELMCSECEPFGRVTLEGMRSGLVVIGSDTGGTPEIITDKKTGLLYRQGSFEDLAQKIKCVYEDEAYAKSLAGAAYEFSRTHFTPETNVNEINRVLEEVLNK